MKNYVNEEKFQRYVKLVSEDYEKFKKFIIDLPNGCKKWDNKCKNKWVWSGRCEFQPHQVIYWNLNICPLCNCGDCYDHGNPFWVVGKNCGFEQCMNTDHAIISQEKEIYPYYLKSTRSETIKRFGIPEQYLDNILNDFLNGYGEEL